MPIRTRRDATQFVRDLPPRVPQKWTEESAQQWAMDLSRWLEKQWDLMFRIQANGVDQPLRAKLNFVSATVTDDLANDRLNIS